MTILTSTPILVVEAIEPSLELWIDRLGYVKTTEVPEGDRLGFVILSSDAGDVMYQTVASIDREVDEQGLPEAMRASPGGSVLYLKVDDLDDVRRRVEGLADVEIVVPHRETFYGAAELWLREPGGHLIGFAAFAAGA